MAGYPEVQTRSVFRPDASVDKEGRAIHSPDDIVVGMLGNMEGSCFTTDHRKIHTAMFSLREKYPLLLRQFVFTDGDVYPRSPLLERVFERLGLSRFLVTVGSDFDPYILRNKKRIEAEILPEFTEKEREVLGEMAKEFWVTCGVEERP